MQVLLLLGRGGVGGVGLVGGGLFAWLGFFAWVFSVCVFVVVFGFFVLFWFFCFCFCFDWLGFLFGWWGGGGGLFGWLGVFCVVGWALLFGCLVGVLVCFLLCS